MSSPAYHLGNDRRQPHAPTPGIHHAALTELGSASFPTLPCGDRRRTSASSRADALAAEDHAEDTGWLDPLDRLTCRVHCRWIHECAHSDLHVIEVVGHRWCRPCRRALEIAVDEVTRTVTLHCPRCDRGAITRADRQLVTACEASLTAARATHRPADVAA